MGACQLFKHTF